MKFIKNVGRTDKTIRLLLGAVLLFLALFSFGLSSGLGIGALIVSIVLFATALINFCPLFSLLGISSFRP